MPISFIILISLAFAWLGYETKGLSVRLLVGAEPIQYPWDRQVWYLCNRFNLKEWMGCLCGWDWLAEHKDFTFETRIQLSMNGNRYDMLVKQPDILREVMKANTQKHKPKLEVYSPSHYVDVGLGHYKSVVMHKSL